MQNRIMIPGILALAIMGAMPAVSNAATQQAQPRETQASAPQADKAQSAVEAPAPRGPRAAKMTPEEREKMEAVFAKYSEKMQPLEDKIYVKKHELRALENAPQPDVKAVGAKAEEIIKLRRELDKMRREMAKEAGLPVPAWGGPCGGFGPKGFKGPKGHGKPGPRGCAPCPAADM